MRKKLYILLATLGFLTYSNDIFAQDANTKIKAIFIYNFAKYVEWPPQKANTDFVITLVTSNTGLIKELEKMALTCKVGSQKIVIKVCTKPSEIGTSNLLFLGNDKISQLNLFTSKCLTNNILLVTEGTGLIKKGAILSFVYSDNKQQFELSKINAKKAGLYVSNNLANMAKTVEQ